MKVFCRIFIAMFFILPFVAFGNPGSSITFSEDQKIEILIGSLKKLNGAQFYKNGKYCGMSDAYSYLKEKKNLANPKIISAQEFVDKVASKSDTGAYYKIRFSNGNEMLAKDYFFNVLNEL